MRHIVREVEGHCPNCQERRMIKLYYSHSSRVTLCPGCIIIRKDIKYRDDVARRSSKNRGSL